MIIITIITIHIIINIGMFIIVCNTTIIIVIIFNIIIIIIVLIIGYGRYKWVITVYLPCPTDLVFTPHFLKTVAVDEASELLCVLKTMAVVEASELLCILKTMAVVEASELLCLKNCGCGWPAVS